MGGQLLLFPDNLAAVLQIIAAQGHGGLLESGGADNLEKRLEPQVPLGDLRHHQVIALRHQGDEIQAQSLGRGQDVQAHVCRAGVDVHRHGQVGVLFPLLSLNVRRIQVVPFEEMVQEEAGGRPPAGG